MLITKLICAVSVSLFGLTNAAPVAEPNVLGAIADSIDQLVLDIEKEGKIDYTIEKGSKKSSPAIFEENPQLFELHEKLVRIRSVSGEEDAVAGFLKGYLNGLNLGFQIKSDSSGKDVYAYSGSNENSTVLLTSHIDTVPPYFGYSIEEDDAGLTRIYGRGSCDAKGSVAAQIIAAKELIEEGLISAEDLSLLFVFEEEVGGGGMRAINKQLIEENVNWDAVIFGEPTENKLATGHKGLYLAELEVEGLASHSGYPDVGIDANKILIEIMHELENYPWPTSELLNKTTLNIGLIDGGAAANVVSAKSRCTLLMRTAVDTSEIVPIVAEIVGKYKDQAKDIKLTVTVTDDPVSLDYEVDGFETYIASYATDIPNLTQRGFTRYLYGPGSILVAHGATEYVSAESLLKAVDDYKKLVMFLMSS